MLINEINGISLYFQELSILTFCRISTEMLGKLFFKFAYVKKHVWTHILEWMFTPEDNYRANHEFIFYSIIVTVYDRNCLLLLQMSMLSVLNICTQLYNSSTHIPEDINVYLKKKEEKKEISVYFLFLAHRVLSLW